MPTETKSARNRRWATGALEQLDSALMFAASAEATMRSIGDKDLAARLAAAAFLLADVSRKLTDNLELR